MSNVVKVAVPLVKFGITFVRKNWKAIAAASAVVSKFLVDHPEISNRVREQVDRVQQRLVKQVEKRSVEAQITGMLEVVRDEARTGGDGFDSTPWVSRADAIQRDLRIAKLQPRADQKATVTRLRAETDTLVGDLLKALAEQRTPPQPPEST
jgi:hypothetical protein